ncbi:MAG: hypothetical protein Q7V62_10860, partial [Actinomycetota bacterium]|nr:hypothetical protein [Actinomycetota bacterium]
RLVLDLPVGPSAKLHDRPAAVRLRKLFEFVASNLGLEIDVVFTDGAQPIGRGVGAAPADRTGCRDEVSSRSGVSRSCRP